MGFKHQTALQAIPYQHDIDVAHDVKSWVGNYESISSGDREYDDRVNDRDYQVGDIVRFHEFHPFLRKFTQRECDVEITSIQYDLPGLHPAIARLHFKIIG
jgi:hypothetical protein